MRVLLLEPDPISRQTIELFLKNEGMNVYSTDEQEEALDLAKLYDYDLIILEPHDNNCFDQSLIAQIRKARVLTPILILSTNGHIDTKLKNLEQGADGYMTKPFHMEELLMQMRTIVRRSKGHAESNIEVGDLKIGLSSQRFEVDGTRIHLTHKEANILELLALRKGTCITKEMILNHLYGGLDEPEIKIIDVFICKLRKKIRDAKPGAEKCIETVWGRGYQLVDPNASLARKRNNPDIPQPAMGLDVTNAELLAMQEQMAEIRRALGLDAGASLADTMSALKEQKRRTEALLEDEPKTSASNIHGGIITTAVALQDNFAESSQPKIPEFQNGLRLPIGNVFKLGSFIEIDTNENKAANIDTGNVVEFKPIVGAILEILTYYRGQNVDATHMINYLFEAKSPANTAKLGQYISQAQGVLTQLVGRELARTYIQVMSDGQYGMPLPALGYSNNQTEKMAEPK